MWLCVLASAAGVVSLHQHRVAMAALMTSWSNVPAKVGVYSCLAGLTCFGQYDWCHKQEYAEVWACSWLWSNDMKLSIWQMQQWLKWCVTYVEWAYLVRFADEQQAARFSATMISVGDCRSSLHQMLRSADMLLRYNMLMKADPSATDSHCLEHIHACRTWATHILTL